MNLGDLRREMEMNATNYNHSQGDKLDLERTQNDTESVIMLSPEKGK